MKPSRCWLLASFVVAAICPALAQPLSLKQAGIRAITSHPDQELARAGLQAAEAKSGQAQAPFYPRLDASVNALQSQQDTVTSAGNLSVFRPPNDFGVGVSGRQLLADFGKRTARSESAEAVQSAAQERLQQALQDRLFRAAQAYYRLAREREQVSLEAFHLRLVRQRLQDLGRSQNRAACSVDLALSRSDLGIARRSYLEAVNRESLAQVDLGEAMGDSQPYRGSLETKYLPIPIHSLEEHLQLALRQRPALLEAGHQKRASRSLTQAAQADYYPDLSLNADYSFYNRQYALDLRQWSVRLALTVPLFNEPLLSSSLDLAESQARAAEFQEKLVELELNREIQRSYFDARLITERAHQAQIASQRSLQSFVEIWALYRNQSGTCRELSLAQRDLLESQRSAINIELELQLALLQLLRATGGLELEVFDRLEESQVYRRKLLMSPIRKFDLPEGRLN